MLAGYQGNIVPDFRLNPAAGSAALSKSVAAKSACCACKSCTALLFYPPVIVNGLLRRACAGAMPISTRVLALSFIIVGSAR